MGHYHAPNSSSWTISYDPSPFPSTTTTVVVKHWDHNILLVPAFLDKNVKVTASRTLESTNEEKEEKDDETTTAMELGTFSHARGEESTSAWFVKRGMDVTFTLAVAEAGARSGEERKRTGVAAVFAVGTLCVEQHDDDDTCC